MKGFAGSLIVNIISSIFTLAPLIILDTPFLLTFIILFVVGALPITGTILKLIIWIAAFVVNIIGPQDVFAIIYYVVFAIWFFSYALPIILTFIAVLIKRKSANTDT